MEKKKKKGRERERERKEITGMGAKEGCEVKDRNKTNFYMYHDTVSPLICIE